MGEADHWVPCCQLPVCLLARRAHAEPHTLLFHGTGPKAGRQAGPGSPLPTFCCSLGALLGLWLSLGSREELGPLFVKRVSALILLPVSLIGVWQPLSPRSSRTQCDLSQAPLMCLSSSLSPLHENVSAGRSGALLTSFFTAVLFALMCVGVSFFSG